MTKLHFSTDVAATAFEEVWERLASLLGLAHDIFEPGVTEVAAGDCELSLAFDPAIQFLAARWHRLGKVYELFFVNPESKPAKLGITCHPTELDIVTHFGKWLNPACAVAKVPSFTVLSSLLAGKGVGVRDTSLRENQLESEVDYLRQLLAEQADLLRQTQAQLRDVREQFALASGNVRPAPEVQSDEATWTLAELAEWCAAHESEIVVLPRARNGVKKSIYEDPALIQVALELLAGPYRDYQCGRLAPKDWEAALYATGLRLAGSVGQTIAGSQGDAYFVPWAGRRRLLDSHLLKGGGRDERYCFRLYFFWDSSSQRAVVGSMPAHLANSLS